IAQNFVAGVNGSSFGIILFKNGATAGSMTVFTSQGALLNLSIGGATEFSDTSNAGSAMITNEGGVVSGAHGGETDFVGTASASSATITNNGGLVSGANGGQTLFLSSSTAGSASITNNSSAAGGLSGRTVFNDNSNAGSATITNNPGTVSGEAPGQTIFDLNGSARTATITNVGAALSGAFGGDTDFMSSSTAGNATITNNGGTVSGAKGGSTNFSGSAATAGSATITSNAGTISGASGGFTAFFSTSTAGSATLIANGGAGAGGSIRFLADSAGGTARVEVFGNGRMDISSHNNPGVTIGSLEGTGDVFLGALILKVGSNDMSTTFSGVIQDGGASGGTGGQLYKIGSGSLTLSHDNTYSGGTTIFDNGTLVVDSLNALGTGDLVPFFGAATVETKDNSPRTFNVGGGFFFTAGTLRMQIGGTNSGVDSDLMAVTKNVVLGQVGASSLFLHRINNFMPMNGQTVTIITAVQGVTGMFNQFNSDFTGLIQPIPIYNPNDVMIQFVLSGSFVLPDLTPNQRSVAHELDEVANDPRASALIGFLGTESPGDLPHDYDLIAPEELASIYEIGFSQSVVQNMNLQHRMDDIRAGSNGFCANGFTSQVSGKDYSKGSDGKAVLDNKPAAAFAPGPDNRWGVFVTGSGDFVNVGNHDDNAHGYDITTGNVTVGVDYRVCDHFAIGIDGGYSGSWADLVNRGRVEVDGGKAGAYATVYGYKFLGADIHVDGAVSGGWNNYDTHRYTLENIQPIPGDFADGSTDGSEFNAMISYGGDYHFGCLLVGTWSSIQYTKINIDKFTETGSLAPLEIQNQDEDSFRGTTGMRVAYDWRLAGSTIIRPEVRAAWQHESGDRSYPIEARFASGAGDVFTVHGPVIGRDSALVDAGFSIMWNNRISTYVYYDGVLGRYNYDNNSVSAGFRVSF
ncbi:MAG: autotransporter domain-containing protein, partial [Verrucomicrobiota bacterium]